ncbi:2-dehydropantoate 2-reductase [Exilibacterium tricleocarpae]|uniref:2-dehydropantoate 2-reductase n=1 Tax=Exilibacterium tricleocarpae TaxID=2591008 RepID=A0A545TYX2_9GAMM|nr:2-dehydropantoate 2-reductase [Exilibacterium tricleocarpae]TQV82416.1 2-dehydropantoate 2-reductase [Exilibacterium tricleocarpae]
MTLNATAKPRIAVFGAGAIGCYIGGCLAHSGATVVMIGRERVKTVLREHGLHLTDWRGRDQRVTAGAITFSCDPADLAAANIVLVTVKSGDTATAAAAIAGHTRPDALIVSFQNGVRNLEVLQQHLPDHNVLPGMVPFNVVNAERGHFHCGTEGNLALQGHQGLEAPLVTALATAELPTDVYTNISSVQWSKLIMNLSNAINALAGVPLLEQLNNRRYRRVMAACIREALRTARAAGIKPARTGKVIPALLPGILSLPTWAFRKVAAGILAIDPNARSSMYDDLHRKRKTEIDFLNGEVVRLAQQLQLETPVNESIVALIKQAEQAQSGSPKITAEELADRVLA